ncbi:MAG: transglutaminase domain-containing protein [Acidobacteria bacterium]|nr:transglutaminase domain-containing protein [Acidobacteriota bacterium]
MSPSIPRLPRRIRPAAAGLLLAGLAPWAVGCGTAPKRTWTVEEIRADLNHRITPDVLASVEIPFEIDDEIRELAFRVTENLRTDKEKMRAIIRAIRQQTGGTISYDWLSNKTAKSVFREGRGNCLAYTNLFVGMSRAVGVEAVYVDVTTIERVTKEAEVIVNSGHITCVIKDVPDLIFVDF